MSEKRGEGGQVRQTWTNGRKLKLCEQFSQLNMLYVRTMLEGIVDGLDVGPGGRNDQQSILETLTAIDTYVREEEQYQKMERAY